METIETQVERTSPVLRVADISDDRKNDKDSARKYNEQSETSRSGHSGDAILRNTSSYRNKKKSLRPIFSSPNAYHGSCYNHYTPYINALHQNPKSNVSLFTQRVMSAKLLRVKQLQNELKETQIQLTDIKNENRLLKTLQKRQDNALKKYEGAQAQLPQLVKSHGEEMRVLSTRYKQLKANYKVLEDKLNQRETELAEMKDKHRHIIKLAKDKQLGQRERLTKEVEDLKDTVREQNDRIQMLTRRIELEGKNYRHQLNLEMNKHKTTHEELTMAHETIESLKNLIEAKDKYINNSIPNRYYRPACGTSQTTGISHTRFRNMPKTAEPVILEKQNSEETTNSTSVDQLIAETDITSDISIHSRAFKSQLSKSQGDLSSTNLRKKLISRRSRAKLTNRPNVPTKLENRDDENDTETPDYSSSLPSINASADNSKYNTSESDNTIRKNSGRKGRRVSIDYDVTIIGDAASNDVSNKNNIKNNNVHNEVDKKVNLQKWGSYERTRRNSVSVCESSGSVEDITESSRKAHEKDRLTRQKSIKDELKELEQKLLKNSKYPLKREESIEALYDKKTLSVKEELKEFEERLLKGGNFSKDYLNSSLSKSFEDEADKVVKKITKELDFSENVSDDEDGTLRKFGLPELTSWNAIEDKLKEKRTGTEKLLDEYYNNLQEDNDNKSDGEEADEEDKEEKDVELGDLEKAKLLKALREIDQEELGGKIYNSDESNKKDSPLHRYNFNTTENKEKPSKKHSVLTSMNNIDQEYLSDFENDTVKDKSDLLQQLFSANNISGFHTEQDELNFKTTKEMGDS